MGRTSTRDDEERGEHLTHEQLSAVGDPAGVKWVGEMATVPRLCWDACI